MRRYFFTLIGIFVFQVMASCQAVNPSLLTKEWPANWITVPNTSPTGYAVYAFRKSISLTEKPTSFSIHVSADNRYKLFVNGKQVSLGPARGDLLYWNYETVDIATYLLAGKNSIAAIVWNEGELRAEGQISNRSAFLLQGNNKAEEIINTDDSWKCLHLKGYKPLKGIGYGGVYYVSGPGETIDMRLLPVGWTENNFDDRDWPHAVNAVWNKPGPKGIADNPHWSLVPSSLPAMELKTERFAAIRKSEGIMLPPSLLQGDASFTIQPNTNATFLLDLAHLSNAYPVLQFSKGINATLCLTYAESLFTEVPGEIGKTFRKGNRNDIENKFILGRKDSIISGGSLHQTFTPLSYRTFRYVQLKISTKEEPLVIEDIHCVFAGYPFQLNSFFKTNDKTIDTMIEIGWRTARACAMDTYMDCPYYEQLQYIGDTRIQALVSLYNSGDDRLMRNAINQMDHSRIAEGITLSRHPSVTPQQIPTFSLWYIGMLHDYWMYRGDSLFVAEKLSGVRTILDFFSKYQQPDGSLRNVPYWNFTDWRKLDTNWKRGVGPLGSDGSSSILDLQLLWAYKLAASLEAQLGQKAMAVSYMQKASLLTNTIQAYYWEPKKELYADNTDKLSFSQHANTLAILTEVIKGKAVTQLARKILTDTTLASASIYFKYYVHQALIKAGLGNEYLQWLDVWRENIAMGLTTWAELSNIDNSRSDCHAWGCSPNIEFFRTILGIDSDKPGFKKVKIEPHLGKLKDVQGRMPHPAGVIDVDYKLTGKKWKIIIILPAGVPGTFVWNKKVFHLKGGKNTLTL